MVQTMEIVGCSRSKTTWGEVGLADVTERAGDENKDVDRSKFGSRGEVGDAVGVENLLDQGELMGVVFWCIGGLMGMGRGAGGGGVIEPLDRRLMNI